MNDSCLEFAKAFSNANGISGFEDDVLKLARGFIAPSIHIEEDKIRNLYLRSSRNTGNRPVVMIDGHSDEVGFMIQSINKNGTLKFIPVGGWSSQVVMGQRVKVRNAKGEYIPAIVAAKPPHFIKAEDKNKAIDIADMFIDVGAMSKAEVCEDHMIEPGAPVVPDVDFSFDAARKMMMGKAFDCRLGCAAVIETLNRLEHLDAKVDVVGTLSSQEELGLRGAQVAARRVDPDVAIIFEGTPADDVFKDEDAAQSVLKKGPQIRHRDNSMMANPRFVGFARKIARRASVPFQDAVRDSGGTNGGMVTLAGRGVPVVVLGVPVRYIHAPHGLAAIDDLQWAVAWACEIIKQLDEDIIKGF
ncbi:glutamyl aminopeptidase, M42 family [Desulfosarcina variabilis str. Montpellier]|uniref:M42 family metallopeptidase n=1 Tax=Desulfosarcina variabilis TaxID=2300 RepID=UPI003AFA8628